MNSLISVTFLRRNLCGLTCILYLTLARDSALTDSREGLVNKFCVVFPLVLVVLAYVFDSDENMDSGVDNGILNVARHSCECFFRQILPPAPPTPTHLFRYGLKCSMLLSCSFPLPSQMQHEVLQYEGRVAVATHSSSLEWWRRRCAVYAVMVEDRVNSEKLGS